VEVVVEQLMKMLEEVVVLVVVQLKVKQLVQGQLIKAMLVELLVVIAIQEVEAVVQVL
jgi:hypothetical protein